MANKVNPMEQPSEDDEDSACIGETTDPPERTYAAADTDSGPDADRVYGSRW